jgi:hypothetical protein
MTNLEGNEVDVIGPLLRASVTDTLRNTIPPHPKRLFDKPT